MYQCVQTKQTRMISDFPRDEALACVNFQEGQLKDARLAHSS